MVAERQYIDVPFEVKAEDIREDGIFEGWGSLFDNKPDAHRDLVARGAFRETLAQGGRNKTGVAMLWQHRSDKVPPGVWLSLTEETRGLKVKGQLALETQLGKEAYEIMKLGAKTGMWRFSLSIGFDTLDHENQKVKVGDATINVRLIKKAELWEISIVTFPAKVGATVTTVKMIEEAKTERELEEVLRESGLSIKAAQYIVRLCKPSLREAGQVEKEPNDRRVLSVILDSLKSVNQEIINGEMVGILGSLQEINR
jgi:hypothetical protein